jgi:hypothetical protein
VIQSENKKYRNFKIHLKISNVKNLTDAQTFVIKSNSDIFLIAPNEKLLRYAVYTLLETWGLEVYSRATYIPN